MADYEFELVVTQRKPNPDYKKARVNAYAGEIVQPYTEVRQLSIVLTGEEFEAVRAAVLRNMGVNE